MVHLVLERDLTRLVRFSLCSYPPSVSCSFYDHFTTSEIEVDRMIALRAATTDPLIELEDMKEMIVPEEIVAERAAAERIAVERTVGERTVGERTVVERTAVERTAEETDETRATAPVNVQEMSVPEMAKQKRSVQEARARKKVVSVSERTVTRSRKTFRDSSQSMCMSYLRQFWTLRKSLIRDYKIRVLLV